MIDEKRYQGGKDGECSGVPWLECEFGSCSVETGRCKFHRSDGQCKVFEDFYEMICAQPKDVRDRFRSLVEEEERKQGLDDVRSGPCN